MKLKVKMKPNFYYVYLITNTVTNKKYVGSKMCYKTDPHNDEYWGSSKLLKEDYKVYGKTNFIKEILSLEYKDKISMLNGETKYILEYNTFFPNGYNQFLPNKKNGFHRAGIKHTEETKKKMSLASKGKPKSEEHKQHMKGALTEEHKKNLSISGKGISRNKGKKHSEKSKQNMAISHIGVHLTNEHKMNISKSTKGKSKSVRTKKHIENLKKALKGKNIEVNKKIYICPHCNKSGKGNTMRRWHYDNCKFKKCA